MSMNLDSDDADHQSLENKFLRLMSQVLPQGDPRAHLDAVQNFRLFLQDLPKDEFKKMLTELTLPGDDPENNLLAELKEWAGLLYWNGLLRDYNAQSPI